MNVRNIILDLKRLGKISEQISKTLSSFYVNTVPYPWVGGMKVCSRDLGHMAKMAAKPIYGKNPPKIFYSRTGGPISTKLGM